MSTFSHGAFQILAHRIVNPPNWHLKHSIIAIINIIITITIIITTTTVIVIIIIIIIIKLIILHFKIRNNLINNAPK